MDEDQPLDDFLEAARADGHLDPGQVADVRRIAAVLQEVGVALSPAEICIRKRFLTEASARDVQRSASRRRIGRYEVLERLGTGAMGVVWRARDTKLDRVVALKVLARDAMQRKAVRERFTREGRISMQLNHTNIVRGLEFGEASGYRFLALEFVPGETLTAVVERRGRLPEKEALEVAIEVVKALEHLQEFKLVHRDIKPDNLILSADGLVKLCDLGLTRPALLEANELGVEEEAIGTPTYVSPEQIQRPDHIDWRADVYSLGCTLYHALTGAPPFAAKSAAEVTRMQVETSPRDPREHVLELSESAATLVLKMLHKDPAKRYASLVELRDDLRSVRDGGAAVHALSAAPVQPQKPAAVSEVHRKTRAGRHARRGRRSAVPLVVVAVVLLVAIGAAVAYLDSSRRATTGPATANGIDGVDQPDEPASPPGRDPPTVKPAATAPASPREAEAERALAAVRDYVAAAPDDFVEIRKRIGFVTERFEGTDVAKQAVALGEYVEKRRTSVAETHLDGLRQELRPLEEAGKLHTVWLRLQEFPLALEDTPAAAAAATEAERIETAVQTLVGKVETALPGTLAEHRFADGRALVARLEGAEIPLFTGRIESLRNQLDSAVASYETRRAEQGPVFDAAYAAALADTVSGDRAKAERRLEESAAGLDVYGVELATVPADLARVQRIGSATERAWDAAVGKRVAVNLRLRGTKPVEGRNRGVEDGRFVVETTGGRLLLRPDQLAATDLVELARSQLSAGDPEETLALLVFQLACGDLAGARDQARVLRLAGGPVDAAEERLGRVERFVAADVTELTRRAELARLQDRFDDAGELLRSALERLPLHQPTLFALGRVLVQGGHPEEAIATLEQAAAASEREAAVHLWLGRAHRLADDLENAQRSLKLAASAAPVGDPLRVEAERELREVTLELTTTVVRQLSREGDKLFRRKRWDEAEPILERILALTPDDADTAFQLGVTYARQNKLFPAIRTLTLFTRDHPRDKKVAEAHRELAAMERYHGVNRADREKTQDAAAALREGRARDALALYDGAIVWSPLYEPAHRGRVAAWEEIRRTEATTAAARGLLQAADDLLFVVEDDAPGLIARAHARTALGEHRAAAADADRALGVDETSAEAALVGGHARLELGEFDAAAKLFETAQRIEPSGAALYGLGRVAELDGYFQDALDLYTKAIQLGVKYGTRALVEEGLRRARKALEAEER